MTTARDVIAKSISHQIAAPHAIADIVLAALLSAPDSVRQELAALLNPWRPIGTAPKDQHEALMAAVGIVSKLKKRWGDRQGCECDICKADAALRAAGIQIEGQGNDDYR